MFGNKKREQAILERWKKFANNPLAHKIADKAAEILIKKIESSNKLNHLSTLGSAIDITIIPSQRICELGAVANFDVPSMDDIDYAALTEAVGHITASYVDKYVRSRPNIYPTTTRIYIEHLARIKLETLVVYGGKDTLDEELTRLK